MNDADSNRQAETINVRAGDVEGDVKALLATLRTGEDLALMLGGTYQQMHEVAGFLAAAIALVTPLLAGLS
jgi:hypothetical protein